MLNPATADEKQNDPTIRRCLGFARAWVFRNLYVVNLSPIRAPNPKLLKSKGDDPQAIQEINTQFVRQAVRTADLVVAAWGGIREHGRQGQKGLTAYGRGGLPGILSGYYQGRTSATPIICASPDLALQIREKTLNRL